MNRTSINPPVPQKTPAKATRSLGVPRRSRTSVRNSGILRDWKGSSIQRHGEVPHEFRRWPHSLKRRSRYFPAGPHQNCGKFGISPKSFYRVSGKPGA